MSAETAAEHAARVSRSHIEEARRAREIAERAHAAMLRLRDGRGDE